MYTYDLQVNSLQNHRMT